MKELREKTSGRLLAFWKAAGDIVPDQDQEVRETGSTETELRTELESQPSPPTELPDILTAFKDALALKSPDEAVTVGDIQAVIETWIASHD